MERGWVPRTGLEALRKVNSLSLTGNQSPIPQSYSHSFVTILTELSRLYNHKINKKLEAETIVVKTATVTFSRKENYKFLTDK
jgi:hypothetical protein